MSNPSWDVRLATRVNRPPDATPEARSIPCFWRKRTCDAEPPMQCREEYHNNIYGGGALVAAGVAAISLGVLALLGKL